jgi:hypothetical protein
VEPPQPSATKSIGYHIPMQLKKPQFEVSDIAREHGSQLLERNTLTSHQKKVMTAITNCRTAELGGHKERCNDTNCAHERYAYNGCRDRHCPKCNGMRREKWVSDRKSDALPVPYFHMVFTIPHSLEGSCMQQGKLMYGLLFKSVWETIDYFSKDHTHLGAKMGMVALLHTWGQNLFRHTHIHCLLPAGGINAQGNWRDCKQQGKFFVHVKKLSKVFRGKFTDGLIELQQQGLIELDGGPIDPDKKYKHPLYKTKWVVYAKKPLPTSDRVIEYIARYSHRVAISNHRIKEFADGKVVFSWIDYRTSKPGVLSIDAPGFLQRFLTHVLPRGFMKIRHYGILSSRNKAANIALVHKDILDLPPPVKISGNSNWMERFEKLYGHHPKQCPCCKKGLMIAVQSIIPAYRLRQRDGPALGPNKNFYKQRQ